MSTLSDGTDRNPARAVVPPVDMPTSLSHYARETPPHPLAEPVIGSYSWVYDGATGQRSSLGCAPSTCRTSMTFNSGVRTAGLANYPTTLTWEQYPRQAQVPSTTATVAFDAREATEPAPAGSSQALDQELLARLDDLLADGSSTLDQFWNLYQVPYRCTAFRCRSRRGADGSGQSVSCHPRGAGPAHMAR